MLTAEDIMIIKGLHNKGYTVGEIAIRMGIELKEVELVLKEMREVKT